MSATHDVGPDADPRTFTLVEQTPRSSADISRKGGCQEWKAFVDQALTRLKHHGAMYRQCWGSPAKGLQPPGPGAQPSQGRTHRGVANFAWSRPTAGRSSSRTRCRANASMRNCSDVQLQKQWISPSVEEMEGNPAGRRTGRERQPGIGGPNGTHQVNFLSLMGSQSEALQTKHIAHQGDHPYLEARRSQIQERQKMNQNTRSATHIPRSNPCHDDWMGCSFPH